MEKQNAANTDAKTNYYNIDGILRNCIKSVFSTVDIRMS